MEISQWCTCGSFIISLVLDKLLISCNVSLEKPTQISYLLSLVLLLKIHRTKRNDYQYASIVESFSKEWTVSSGFRSRSKFLRCGWPCSACSMMMEQNTKLRLAELEGLESKRLQAQQTLEVYQARMSHAFDKRVRRQRDLILAGLSLAFEGT